MLKSPIAGVTTPVADAPVSTATASPVAHASGTSGHHDSAERYPALDGVRGLAALMVMFWHYVPSISRAEPGTTLAYLAKAGGLCWSGVDLFFVLSGFLIGRILLRERSSPWLLRTFYVRRACRILPLFLFVFALYLIALMTIPAGDASERLIANPFPVWSYAVFLQNVLMTACDHFGTPLLSVTWSLAVEEQFYLIAPLLVVLTPQRWLPWAFATMFLAAMIVRPMLSPMAGYTLLWARADSLAIGCLLACWVEQGGSVWLRKRAGLAIFVGVVFAAAAATYVARANGLWSVTHGWGRFHLTWISAAYALLIAALLAWPDGAVARLFRSRFLCRAGLLSYGIYLLHGPVIHGWFELTTSAEPVLRHTRDLLMLPVIAVIVWLTAEVLHRVIERPFVQLGHKLTYRAR